MVVNNIDETLKENVKAKFILYRRAKKPAAHRHFTNAEVLRQSGKVNPLGWKRYADQKKLLNFVYHDDQNYHVQFAFELGDFCEVTAYIVLLQEKQVLEEEI
ncbi:hypothetical protein Glove_168g104 [Diversispora epigaea]|uniref:Uncharacterized protein n=1 Tax=Diversispora epigaea TaxID=1348612 RepID=A0A397IW42_9GLOM|nr:hypothetical protein Glove_168g104 [Diversispora epigaea]